VTGRKQHSIINADFLAGISRKPGVYLMYSRKDTVLYVGKARDLRKRLTSYSRWDGSEHSKTTVLLSKLKRLETIITRTEKEAFILEASLIKKYRPKYNVILRDDKNYPYIKITVTEKWPRLVMTRRKKDDGNRYFGPYSSSSAMWSTIKLLNSLFPLRRCKTKEIKKRTRPCLNHQMKRCLAPCMGLVDVDTYHDMVQNVILVLEGHNHKLLKKIEKQMVRASKELLFEEAALFRDQLSALTTTLEKQVVVGKRKHDQDIFGFKRHGASAAVSIVTIQRGVVSGHRSFFLAEPIGEDRDVLSEVIRRYYSEKSSVPKEIILPFPAESQDSIAEWLTDIRQGSVSCRTPQRGDLVKLLELATSNARQVFADREKKEKSWQVMADGLADTLHLASRPDLIECLDISNISGKQAVGALVCYQNGEKLKKRYRHYNINTVTGPDDYSMMAEVLERRFSRGMKENDLPDMLLVDGGKGQLNIALKVAKENLVADRIDFIGIAKEKNEEGEKIFRPGRKNAIVLPRHSPILLYLMKIRDEAHRYGIIFHRKQRRKNTLSSELDMIPGIGEQRKKQLLSKIGSLQRIKSASVDELANVPGVGIELAKKIHHHFRIE
jgi:excinuclease ABC subunit C